MKERKLTCIICPRGCELTVALGDAGEVLGVSGNACARGEVYANTECTNPTRTVTTTVRCADGSVVPVKTSIPVPKGMIVDVMREINRARIDGDVKVGQVVIEKVAGTDADVVITGKK